MKISKSKSCKYWKHLKNKILADFDNKKNWEDAFDLFEERINSRYLNQIKLIEKDDTFSGEGFSIMAIYCSLIEFLETTAQGINFRLCKKKELKKYEYTIGESKKLFTSFLMNRTPFKFDEKLAKLFYEDVRCGLLHEAQTKSNWKIRVDNDRVITQKKNEYIINRKKFGKKVDQYILLYRKKLLNNNDLQKAYIRKFDNLCK